MIFIPPTPDLGGEMLAAYIAAEPHRRAVFRGILLCTHYLLPDWAKDNPDAAAQNRAFTAQHREQYHAFHAALIATPVEAARAD